MAGNLFSSWMTKPAGLTSKDLTEAQITERNRSNPMGGYGFMSAAEKNQLAQQQALQQQLIQDQQDFATAQLSPTQQVNLQLMQSGRNLGRGIAGFMQRGQPQPQTQDDPAIARFNELASQVGPSQAKILLGQELLQQGNPSGAQMIMDGQKELDDKKKVDLDTQSTQLGIDEKLAEKPSWGYEHKPGFTDELDQEGTGANAGIPGVVKRELLANTPEGSVWKIGKWAPKGSVTGTRGELTGADASQAIVDFRGRLTASANVIDQIEELKKSAKENPDALTGTATVATWLDNAARDIGAGARALTGRKENTPKVLDLGNGKYKTLNPEDYTGLFEELRIPNAVMKSRLMEVTYDIISIEQGTGARPTDSDFRETLKQLGGNLRDPKAFASVLDSKIENTLLKLDNAAEFTSNKEGTPFSKIFENEIKSVKGRRKKEASGKTVLMRRSNGDMVPIPEEQVEEAKKHGYTLSGQ